MTKLAATILSLALLTGSGHTLAQEDVATLQAKNAKLQTELSTTQARLRRAIAYSRSNRSGLEEQLENATAGREYAEARLRRAIAYSRSNRMDIETKLESATASRNHSQARLRRAIAHSRANRKKLESVTAARDHSQARLRRAIAHSRANRKKLESATTGRDQYRARLARSIEYNRAERSKLEKQLNSATVGRDHLRETLLSTLDKHENVEKQLKSATVSRDHLHKILLTTLGERDTLKTQLNSAQVGRNHLREKLLSTMKKPGDWADNKLSSLNSSIGGLQGTQIVANRNNSVTVRVGNDTGLFRTGSTRLSDNGSELLSQIAQELTQHPNASMTVIGHTDNIPVGEGNRYANNQALSLARAVAAVEFLNNEGISATQLSAAGFGAEFPIADNSNEEGRRINRRVEIELRAN